MPTKTNIFQQKSVKTPPTRNGRYETDKGFLYYFVPGFFTADGGWSCRDDRPSDEFPKFWYDPVDIDFILNDVLNGRISGKYKTGSNSNQVAEFVTNYLNNLKLNG